MNVWADVSDFDIELSTGGLKNKRVDVIAQLLLPSRDPTRQRVTSVVPIVLDGLPPTFRDMRIDERVVSGEKVSVAVDAADLGGVVIVEAAFDMNETQSMEKEDKPKKLRRGSDGVWAGSLDTKDLEPGIKEFISQSLEESEKSTCSLKPDAANQYDLNSISSRLADELDHLYVAGTVPETTPRGSNSRLK